MPLSTKHKPVIPMRVDGVVLEPGTQAPAVMLRGVDDPRLCLAMYIGGLEANAIATALADVELPRPMTHDLIHSMLAELGATLARVVITDLIDGTFYAELTLVDESAHEHVIDARPSDGLALALRTGAAVYASRAVLAAAATMATEATTEDGGAPAGDTEHARAPVGPCAVTSGDVNLEDLDPETFGDYKM
ncbi:MAG: bifunctional nuclease family protein [Myxococcota bacterium]